MTFKQIIQLESITCMHLHNILNKFLANSCFDASIMDLSRFVAFRVTFTIYAVELNDVDYCHAYNSG